MYVTDLNNLPKGRLTHSVLREREGRRESASESLSLHRECSTFRKILHLVLQNEHSNTGQALFPSVPLHLSLALTHVGTLIIAFFHMFYTCGAKGHLSSPLPRNLEHQSHKKNTFYLRSFPPVSQVIDFSPAAAHFTEILFRLQERKKEMTCFPIPFLMYFLYLHFVEKLRRQKVLFISF